MPTDTNEDEWRIAGQQALTSIEGLNRLVRSTRRSNAHARNLVVHADDLDIRLDDGRVFVADTPDGPTSAVLDARPGRDDPVPAVS